MSARSKAEHKTQIRTQREVRELVALGAVYVEHIGRGRRLARLVQKAKGLLKVGAFYDEAQLEVVVGRRLLLDAKLVEHARTKSSGVAQSCHEHTGSSSLCCRYGHFTPQTPTPMLKGATHVEALSRSPADGD